MRTWSLALLVVGGACVPAPPAPPAPPLPRLTTPGHLFLISTEDVAAHCQRWDVVPSVGGRGQLVREIDISGEAGVDTIDYHLRGATLTLTGRTRGISARLSSMGCEVHLPSVDLVDAVAVGDSRWFTDAAGCDRALAQHARVATDLTQCDFEPFVPDAVQQATRRRFEELLRRGGVAYAVEGDAGVPYADEDARCEPFNVTPSKHQRAGRVAGSMWREIVSHGVRGKTRTAYMYLRGGRRVGRNGPDELARLGAGVTSADGSGYGIGCASTAFVSYGRRVVYADGTLYLTRAACQDAIAAQQLHDAWVPEVAEVDEPDENEDADAVEPDTEESERTAGGEVTDGDVVEADELTDGDEDADATWTSFALSGC